VSFGEWCRKIRGITLPTLRGLAIPPKTGLFHPKYERIATFRNVGAYLSDDKASRSSRTVFSTLSSSQNEKKMKTGKLPRLTANV